MRKRWIVLLVFIILLALVSVALYLYYTLPANRQEIGSQNVVYINITKENFAQILSSNSFVRDLPKDAVISLKVDEDYYTMMKGSVSKERTDSADFQISLPSEYLPMLGNLCSALDSAKKNGDFGFETGMSKTSLMWKYKSMLKYRNCFGF